MRRLLDPWRAPQRLLRDLGNVSLALVSGTIGFTLVITMLSTSAGLVPVFLVGIPLMALSLWVTHQYARAERSRLSALSGEPIADPVPPLMSTTWLAKTREMLASGPRWREAGYALALLIPAVLAFSVVIPAWAASVGMLSLPATIWAFPRHTARMYFLDVEARWSWVAAVIGAIGVLFVAPWLTRGFARMLTGLAQSMLGPSTTELTARADRAERTRSAAVDAAEAERRRIERDLHDGAQQRLVALAADLGSARERMEHDPEGARQLVTSAHEEAKGALREIRDLVRGIHPVILEDRGLSAALSAVVARSPVPVQLDVHVVERLPAAVESTAYFVVTEALANVARHSRATRAWVSIERSADRLVIEVRDDGSGGADASRGTGLQGLRDRVNGLGGSLYVISPDGGPTTISVELPCGS